MGGKLYLLLILLVRENKSEVGVDKKRIGGGDRVIWRALTVHNA